MPVAGDIEDPGRPDPSDWTLPSGLPASTLGFRSARGWLDLPLGLVVPEAADADRLLQSVPGPPRRPAWWNGRAERENALVAVSVGAVSLNSQALPLLRAAEVVAAPCLVVIAPVVSDEALATLLVNDIAGAFPHGILPLRTLVPEWHVDEAVEAVARLLGVSPWDGRPDSVELAAVAGLSARPEHVRVRLRPESGLRRAVRRLLRRG